MKRTVIPLLLAFAAAPARAGIPAEQEDCLGCHSDPDQTFALPSGEKLSLFVDQEAFAAEERRRFELLEAHWDVVLEPQALER